MAILPRAILNEESAANFRGRELRAGLTHPVKILSRVPHNRKYSLERKSGRSLFQRLHLVPTLAFQYPLLAGLSFWSDDARRLSETGRIRFRRVRFQTPSCVSFGPRRAPGRELSEFLLAYYLCAKPNSPSFWQKSPSLPYNSVRLSEFSSPKQYSRNSIPPVS